MSQQQLERLKKDKNELGYYIQRMKKKGREDVVYKLMKKQAYLEQTIEEQLT
jgi:hypothetical protein